MTTDLYISTYVPTLGTGRAQRTYTCVRALALLGPVDLAYVPFDGDGPSPEYTAIDGLTLHPINPSRRVRRLRTYASTCARGVPHNVARGVSRELVQESARLAAAPGRGRVIVDGLTAAAALLPLAHQRPIVYNAHNAGPSYHAPAGQTTPWTRLLFTSFERRVLRSASESWMVSRRDMEVARDFAPSAGLRYVPNAVDVAKITPVPAANRLRRRLLMVGDFTYKPNQIGRAFLIDQVLPRLWQELPDVQLMLVGRGYENWASPDPRVEVAGFVDDLAGAYAQSDCVVVPITTGGGSPLKFIEALAYGVPIVATPFAAQGLEVTADEHYLEGVDAPSFASAILDVLCTGAAELATEGRRIAEAEYSIEALAQRLAASLEHSPGRQYPTRG
jgi:glycosyltransferase involved in cell wall biosynthesis